MVSVRFEHEEGRYSQDHKNFFQLICFASPYLVFNYFLFIFISS